MSDVKPKNEKTAEPKVRVRFLAKSYKIAKGDERDVDAATAELLIENGHAVAVK